MALYIVSTPYFAPYGPCLCTCLMAIVVIYKPMAMQDTMLRA